MGCISSKVLARSMSFRNDLRKSLHEKSNSIASLEDLLTSGNARDQFLALVGTTNTVASKLGTETSILPPKTNPNPCPDLDEAETINASELMKGLEEVEQKRSLQSKSSLHPSLPKLSEVHKARRSKSCQWSPENEIDAVNEDSFYWDSKTIVRCRSFHTVEEYDAMVETMMLSSTTQEGFSEDFDLVAKTQPRDFESSSEKFHQENLHNSSIKKAAQSVLARAESFNQAGILSTSQPKSQGGLLEKGLKRRAVARGLNSLSIPSSIEFPNIASFMEQVRVDGQVYSPGTYVTPKFGCYNLPKPGSIKESGENSIFDPELVATFEECMQRFAVDEEIILRDIEATLEEDKESEAKIEMLSEIQDWDARTRSHPKCMIRMPGPGASGERPRISGRFDAAWEN